MVIDERTRQLHEHLYELLGEEDASTLIKQLSPVPWSDLATRADVEDLRTGLDGVEARLDGVETRLDGVETRLEGLESTVGELRSGLDEFRSATNDEFHAVHTELRVLTVRMDAGFESMLHQTRGLVFDQVSAILQQINSQTRTMIFTLITVVIALASVFLARGG